MSILQTTLLTCSAVAAAFIAAPALGVSAPSGTEAFRCSPVPGRTLALVHVERDTVLPFAAIRNGSTSYTGAPMTPRDTLLALPGTPMPAARVRLLQVDSATRATLAAAGVAGDQPTAFLRAAPFREDCRVVRWTSDTPGFVMTGEEGYVRADLAPSERWIEGTPVFVVSQTWYYPYPHRRGLVRSATGDAPIASARAMFGASLALERPMARTREERVATDSIRRERAIAWIAAHPLDAEAEPVRSMLRRAVLDADWAAASSAPSRLRGTWRVDVEADRVRQSWFFRTHDRPGYGWAGREPELRAAAIAASPWTPGYRIVGYPSAFRDSLVISAPRGPTSRVWLSTDDRPTAPGNDARRAVSGILEFTLGGAPQALWHHLERFVPPPSSAAFRARSGNFPAREQLQPQLPITVRFDGRGGARADTTLTAGGRRLRVVLTRLDTVSITRPF